MVLGFTFNNVHSSNFKILVKSVDRSLAPSLRKNTFTIPNRHGEVNFDNNFYDNRTIQVTVQLIGDSFEDLRETARQISKWLDGTDGDKNLIFDDEKDKQYKAIVYTAKNLTPVDLMPLGTSGITFECEPFAESIDYRQENKTITDTNETVECDVNGNTDSCCIITLTNTGNTDITGIQLIRKGDA